MKNIYLSFVRDGRFAGATIIFAENAESAARIAWARGLNPGGEIAAFEILAADMARPEYQLCIGRLATKDELLCTGKFVRVGDS